jgi:hypothetical protein
MYDEMIFELTHTADLSKSDLALNGNLASLGKFSGPET